MTNQVKIGSRKLKPGDRVVQSRSIQYMAPVGTGFPWEVVHVWDGGEMAQLRYVGECGTLDEGYAHAVLTKYLVKMGEELPVTEDVTLVKL